MIKMICDGLENRLARIALNLLADLLALIANLFLATLIIVAAYLMLWGIMSVFAHDCNHYQDKPSPCEQGQAVYVNGELVGCTGDPKSPANTWVPE